jgi:steroid 5-alpha reductase family enzyme
MIATILAVLAATALIWIISLPLEDVSIIDIFWAPGFALISAVSIWWVKSLDADGLIVATLVTIWALRLGTHLFLRWRRAGHEDRRYAAMRKKSPGTFAVNSLFTVFWLQAAIMWFVSLPIQMMLMAPHEPIDVVAVAGGILAAIGILIEAIADRQLTRFGRDPANQGRVLDTGLWSWSRHPNYFGDALMWWGLFAVCVSGGAPAWTAICPAVMTFSLLRVSGVTLLERKITDRRPEYTDYISRTNAFIPWPPKKNFPPPSAASGEGNPTPQEPRLH